MQINYFKSVGCWMSGDVRVIQKQPRTPAVWAIKSETAHVLLEIYFLQNTVKVVVLFLCSSGRWLHPPLPRLGEAAHTWDAGAGPEPVLACFPRGPVLLAKFVWFPSTSGVQEHSTPHPILHPEVTGSHTHGQRAPCWESGSLAVLWLCSRPEVREPSPSRAASLVLRFPSRRDPHDSAAACPVLRWPLLRERLAHVSSARLLYP